MPTIRLHLRPFLAISFIILLVALVGTPNAFALARLNPILEGQPCSLPNGTVRATFGYNNRNATSVNVPVGANNFFNPAPTNRGQPTTFLPGRQVAVFTVTYPAGSLVVWALSVPGVAGGTATAGNPTGGACPSPSTDVTITKTADRSNYIAGDLITQLSGRLPSLGGRWIAIPI